MPYPVSSMSKGGALTHLPPEIRMVRASRTAELDYSAADVFGLGMTAYGMLSAMAPFVTDNPAEFSASTFRPLPHCYPAVVRSAVWRMLDPDPKRVCFPKPLKAFPAT